MTNPLHDTLVAPLAGRRTAVLIDAAGREIPGAALHGTTLRLARALVELGLAPGDRMAVQVEKTPEALAL
jgi:malonyl-CoA/methylmalonyl-CoA synthetase